MTRYRVRMVEFVGDEEFIQGIDMTWDSVVVDVADDEHIVQAQASWTRGEGFDAEVPVVRLWLMAPESDTTR